jgi:hypothetical protein
MRRFGPLRLAAAAMVVLSLGALSGRGATDCGPGARSAEAAMAAVVAAMRQDAAMDLAALLPRETPLRLTTTIEEPYLSEDIIPAMVVEDFDAKEGIYELLFESESEDAFRDVFLVTGFGPWVPAGPDRFIPAGPQYEDGRTFVQFGCEAGERVIVEIGWPAS